ncbi:MAG: hypothetical protein PWQ74_606 [Methanobacteriaceae archaeon]|nr:hypothetical protein [Methanobacteriaceae archaeon]
MKNYYHLRRGVNTSKLVISKVGTGIKLPPPLIMEKISVGGLRCGGTTFTITGPILTRVSHQQIIFTLLSRGGFPTLKIKKTINNKNIIYKSG